eukprot:scaffold1727_cov133-Cylindrotheca_fusiformis.AAC.5
MGMVGVFGCFLARNAGIYWLEQDQRKWCRPEIELANVLEKSTSLPFSKRNFVSTSRASKMQMGLNGHCTSSSSSSNETVTISVFC